VPDCVGSLRESVADVHTEPPAAALEALVSDVVAKVEDSIIRSVVTFERLTR